MSLNDRQLVTKLPRSRSPNPYRDTDTPNDDYAMPRGKYISDGAIFLGVSEMVASVISAQYKPLNYP